MKHKFTFLIVLLCALAQPVAAKPMKARTIQPLFAKDAVGLQQSLDWTLRALEECDPTLDIIVLPEFSEVPGSTANSEFIEYVKKNGPALLDACAATAKRCSAIVFCGAIEITEFGPRNTLFVYDRQGNVVGRYLKEHLTRGEWANLGFDKSYTEEWNAPYMIELEGVKYAFLTCYDFYFYENYSNIARFDPDVVIGSSHQRSDTHRALDIIDSFCAYNIGAYVVRASVSMGEDSPLGGCSCVVAPTGEILGNMYSRVGVLDVFFDPAKKYLKPAGYGNPPAKHCQYIDAGRRPWKYRPGGPAMVLPLREALGQRICATRGFSQPAKADLMAAYGAAVGVGAGEIQVAYDGTTNLLYQVLHKFSCQTIINIKMNSTEGLDALAACVKDFDAQGHVYLTVASAADAKAVKATGLPVCLVVKGAAGLAEAAELGCTLVQADSKAFGDAFAARAHELGLRVNVVCTNKSAAAKALAAGADTIIADDYQAISKAVSLK